VQCGKRFITLGAARQSEPDNNAPLFPGGLLPAWVETRAPQQRLWIAHISFDQELLSSAEAANCTIVILRRKTHQQIISGVNDAFPVVSSHQGFLRLFSKPVKISSSV